jgi:alpha-1,2-mannosyltransferase
MTTLSVHAVPDGWLQANRIVAWSRVLFIGQLILFLVLIAGTHGFIVALDKPSTTDFVSFYAAGGLAAAGSPELAYDQVAHYAAEQAVTAVGIGYQFFFYPPTFLLLVRQLARLPYLTAFVTFEAVTLALYLVVMRGILGERGRQWLLPVLAFPSLFWTLGLGQNSFLTAALFGAAMLLLEKRPALSGVCFGALCYKPHFGLLIPLVLTAGERWKTLSATAFTVIGLVGLSVIEFGVAPWRDYLVAFSQSWSVYESGRLDFSGFVTPFGTALLAGLSPHAAYSLQVMTALGAIPIVTWIWRQDTSLPIKAAALAAGTLLSVPVALVYDMMVLTIAIAWLAHAGRRTGFQPGEKIVLAAVYLVPLLSRGIGTALHIGIGPLAAIALLTLSLVRARDEVRTRAMAGALASKPA